MLASVIVNEASPQRSVTKKSNHTTGQLKFSGALVLGHWIILSAFLSWSGNRSYKATPKTSGVAE
jgi:hypothetical protein